MPNGGTDPLGNHARDRAAFASGALGAQRVHCGASGSTAVWAMDSRGGPDRSVPAFPRSGVEVLPGERQRLPNPLAPSSSPGWPTRSSISLPIRRALAARCLRCVLTYTSTLRALLATDPPSHDGSKPICRFWSWLLAHFDLPSLASADSAGGMLRCLPHHEGSAHTPLRFA